MSTENQAVHSESPPWVSFCLATYRRPDKLRQVLVSILAQSFQDFELIVSDNDPDKSSRATVEDLKDKRLRYFNNAENVGMIKNFNIAIGHARGQYLVMITDDDPLYPHMLATLHALTQRYPGYGAYYGACEVTLENRDVAETYQTDMGKLIFTADLPVGSIREYSTRDFPRAFFKRRIFPYMLWSTGIIRREIVLRIGGVPDYGSPFLADFAYIAAAGEQQGFIAANMPLGYQAIHGQNSGFSDPHSLLKALHGCHSYLSGKMASRSDWEKIRPYMESYLATYAIAHTVAMQRHYRKAKKANMDIAKLEEPIDTLFAIPYIKKLRYQYYILKIMDFFPLLRWLYNNAKKAKQRAATAWFRTA